MHRRGLRWMTTAVWMKANSVCASGYLPSFCTACYRQGRTATVLYLAKTGEIKMLPARTIQPLKNTCLIASPATRELGEKVIAEHLAEIKYEKVRELTKKRLDRIEQGVRDLYF